MTQDRQVCIQPVAARCRNAVAGRAVLTALLLWSAWASRASGTEDFSARVSLIDGGAPILIRGDQLFSATRGATLQAGDLLQTPADSFVVIELHDGAVIALGPATQLYLPTRAEPGVVRLPRGWIKVDTHAGALRLMGPRIAVECRQAVVLLHADEQSDALFDEQGAATLWLRDRAEVRQGSAMAADQFLVQSEGAPLRMLARPSPEFLQQMPVPFRDPLPAALSARATASAPQLLRAVSYADLQSWLNVPAAWRAGFIERFRSRLKDPAFFAAMDAHLAQYPEWQRILHPPPPPQPADTALH